MGTVVLVLLSFFTVAFVAVHVIWYIRPSAIKDRDTLNHVIQKNPATLIELYSNF